MILDVIKDAILQNIGPLKKAPKNWNKRNCMLCHTQGHGRDTRNRFGIQFNSNSIACNCFNCGFSAGYTEGKELSKSFKFFLTNLNIDQKFIQELEFDIFKIKNSIKETKEGSTTEEDPETKYRKLFHKWQKMDLPKDSLPVSTWLEYGLEDRNFLNVAQYALDRNLTDLDQFYWSPDTFRNINQRLIIPYYYRKNIVGFTARLCYDTPDKSIPKYYQQVPTDFVYNLDNQQDWNRKYCILNEGVLDAWTTDGISTLGEISQTQIDIINRLQKEIIVCPDRDLKGEELIEAAIANNWSVSFPPWPKGIKDATKAAEIYGRLLTTHSIIAHASKGELHIRSQWAFRKIELGIKEEKARPEKENELAKELRELLNGRK